MSLISFFRNKLKPQKLSISKEFCQKLASVAKELQTLLGEQITDLLLPNYENFSLDHLKQKMNGDKKVFEAATLGLGIVKIVEICEEKNLGTQSVKALLKHLQDNYSNEETGCIYNHAMKYIHEYKEFRNGEMAEKLQDLAKVHSLYTGAWVTRYFLGEEATIKFQNATEIGSIILDQVDSLFISQGVTQ